MDTDDKYNTEFFYLDQRLLDALKEDNIEKYLEIIKEKNRLKFNHDNQNSSQEIQIYRKDMYKDMYKDINKKIFEEREKIINERIIYQFKMFMIYEINQNILKLEDKLKISLKVLEDNIKKHI
jgi:hypothetical protein